MTYAAKVVADSVGPHGVRITTMSVVFPRFILAEFNTHRVFSRNSASSRAIPPEKLIARVLEHPFVPETFNKRVKGMGVGDTINGDDADQARMEWLSAASQAALHAKVLQGIGVDKSRVNRLLEPFLWHACIVTSTEWENFFALRQPDNDDLVPQIEHGAQPEMQIIARLMRDVMRDSEPQELGYGDWHLPFLTEDELFEYDDDPTGEKHDSHSRGVDYWPLVSAGRCFVVSYDNLDKIDREDSDASYGRAVRGKDFGHWSPLEHPAMCLPGDAFCGNFRGWRQLRKHYPDESNYQSILDEIKA